MKHFGIFGGTFNPPHIAHSIIAQDIREQFKLDKILFMPSGIPPLKDKNKVISPLHRLAMAALAFSDNEYFEVSGIEIKGNRKKSYTIDTLSDLRNIYKKSGVKFYLIIGMDNLIDFPKWKNPEKLFSYAEIIVINRPFSDVKKAKKEFIKKVTFAEVPMLEISSTVIRNYVKAGKSIKYLVHPDVEEYIYKNKLYKK